jgi:hypothetical protein
VGSTVVNIVIGTIFVFLVFSLIVSGVNEALSAVFAIRSKFLWQTLKSLSARTDKPDRLDIRAIARLPFTAAWLEKLPLIGRHARHWIDHRPVTDGTVPIKVVAAADPAAAQDVHSNAFLDGVVARTERFDTTREQRPTRVKHVSPQVVSQVLLELGGALPAIAESAGDTVRQGEQYLEQILNSPAVKGTQLEAPVRAAVNRAQGDVEKFRVAMEDWFDARMTALSRVYKMWARWVMLVVGLLVALVFNVNPVRTVDSLRRDSALAQATVDQATSFVKTVDPPGDACRLGGATDTTSAQPAVRIEDCYRAVQGAVAASRRLPPPLSFDHFFWGTDGWWQYLLGSVAAGIAISLGAPFWFDALRRLMVLRR